MKGAIFFAQVLYIGIPYQWNAETHRILKFVPKVKQLFWWIYWFTTTHDQSTIPSRYPYWQGHVDGWSMLIDHSEVEGNSCIIGSLLQSVIIVGISSIAKLIFQCEVFIRCLRSKVICKQKPHLPYNHGWYHHHKQSLNFFQVEVQDRGCEMVSVMEIGGDLEQDMVTW